MIKNMPTNLEYEQILISGMLNNPQICTDIILSLNTEEFFDPKNRILFDEIKKMALKNPRIELNILKNYLESVNKINECGGFNYILNICDSFSRGLDYIQYVNEIKRLFNLRRIIHLCTDNVNSACSPNADCENISQDIMKNLFSIQGLCNSNSNTGDEILKKFNENGSLMENYDWIRQRRSQGLSPYQGISSGFPILDDALGYFRNSALYYIGARTSTGKTTFLLNLIRNMRYQNGNSPIGVFSLETEKSELMKRLSCICSDVDFKKYDDGNLTFDELERLFSDQNSSFYPSVVVDDEQDLTISKIRSRARKMKFNSGVKIILIDYLTRIKSDIKYASKHHQIDEVSKGLQSMAKELNVPVICVAQLNRNSLKNELPNLADFKESGSIEEDADGAILLHRPYFSDPKADVNEMQLIIAKNRRRGILKNISFKKSFNSELFQEVCECKFQFKKTNETLFKP